MDKIRGNSLASRVVTVPTLLGLVLVVVGVGLSQEVEHSASEIIRFLTAPVYRPELLNKNLVRKPQGDRAAANSLVSLGPLAIPDLDAALDVVERQEQRAPDLVNSKWLFFAYARIRGPASFQRLQAMADNPRLRYLSEDIDQSLAIALGLTSYISASRIAETFVCCRAEEPRHALDQLVLSWLQGNRQRMEEALGTNARAALGSLIIRSSWLGLRTKMWRGVPASSLALGYRFDDESDWSKPEETLDQGLQDRRRSVNLDRIPAEPDLTTQFVDVAGSGCATREIRFVRVPRLPAGLTHRYVVDDSNLDELLRTITECALAGSSTNKSPQR